MKRSILSCSIGALVLALGVAACSSDSSTGPGGFTVPDSTINKGVAQDAGEEAGTSIDLMTNDEQYYGASQSVVSPGSGINADMTVQRNSVQQNCTGPDSNGWYTCNGNTWRNLTLNRKLRFWAGTNYDLWWNNPSPTDSVNHIRNVTGSYHPQSDTTKTVWVNRNDTATMVVNRGSDTVHVWTGTGVRSDSAAATVDSVAYTFHYTAHDTASAVTFRMPRSTYVWPMSGTLVRSINTLFTAQSGTKNYSKTFTTRVVVTFNGQEDVPITVGGLTCTLDLGTHKVSNCQ